MNILVTGGAGYIGSHTIIELLASGHGVVVVDNLSNSSAESLRRVEEITSQSVPFYEFDLCDRVRLAELFKSETIDAAIHFAGLKAVGESVEKALLYYQNNLESTLTLLDVMQEFDVKKLVFSSSATVYGDPARLPITEDMPLSATNPYGQTKLMIEQILRDVAALEHLGDPDEYKVYNIGTGRGTSVLELVKAFETASGRDVPYQITPRRPGDIAACYADPSLAEAELGWRAELTIEDACRDAWNWQSNNPNGFN